MVIKKRSVGAERQRVARLVDRSYPRIMKALNDMRSRKPDVEVPLPELGFTPKEFEQHARALTAVLTDFDRLKTFMILQKSPDVPNRVKTGTAQYCVRNNVVHSDSAPSILLGKRGISPDHIADMFELLRTHRIIYPRKPSKN